MRTRGERKTHGKLCSFQPFQACTQMASSWLVTSGMPTAQATPSLTDSIHSLDEALSLVAVEEAPASGPAFVVPGAWESSSQRPSRRPLPSIENSAPPIGFMLIMLLIGASAAAVVFHARILQIW